MGFKNAFGRFFGKNNDNQAEEIIEKVLDQVEQVETPTEQQTDTEQVAAYEEQIIEQQAETEPSDKTVEETAEEPVEEIIEETTEETVEETFVPKKSFFAKLLGGLAKTRKSFHDKIDNVLKMFGKIDEELFEELEEALIMADVGVDTSLYIIGELRERVKEKKIKEPEFIKQEIEEIISDILAQNDTMLKLETTPSVIMVIGVNGVGKTTSIGKMAAKYNAEGKKVILGAADTFRAAAIDQLAVWATRSGVDIIKHQEGSDPAAVVFDTITAAKARGADVIILDTAGSLHNKKNLMDELAKIYRVIKRELPEASMESLLVLDAATGQNAVNQAREFKNAADITGIVLTKLDGTARGGIVLAIHDELSIPVKFVGVGEQIDDLQPFDSESFARSLFEAE